MNGCRQAYLVAAGKLSLPWRDQKSYLANLPGRCPGVFQLSCPPALSLPWRDQKSYPARLPCDCRVEQEKKVACQSVVCEGALCSVDDFLVEYDHLVVSVGQPPTRAPRPGYTPRDSDKRKR